jgi:hypothetical protein
MRPLIIIKAACKELDANNGANSLITGIMIEQPKVIQKIHPRVKRMGSFFFALVSVIM